MYTTAEINQFAITLQEKGVTPETIQLFDALHDHLRPQVEAQARKYLSLPKVKTLALNPDDLVSRGLYEHLLSCIKTWNGLEYFEGFFIAVLYRTFYIVVQKELADCRVLNAIATSLNVKTEGMELETLIEQPMPDPDYSPRMLELLGQFGKMYGEEAVSVLKIYAEVKSAEDRTALICKLYGEQEYTPALRKRVQRIKENFKKMLSW